MHVTPFMTDKGVCGCMQCGVGPRSEAVVASAIEPDELELMRT